jgi:hypothetical protein
LYGRYQRYCELDKQLANNTADFEKLASDHERAVARAGGAEGEGGAEGAGAARGAAAADEAAALAERIVPLWDAKQAGISKKLEEYRALHVELKELKAAVNGFVSAAEGDDGAGAEPEEGVEA